MHHRTSSYKNQKNHQPYDTQRPDQNRGRALKAFKPLSFFLKHGNCNHSWIVYPQSTENIQQIQDNVDRSSTSDFKQNYSSIPKIAWTGFPPMISNKNSAIPKTTWAGFFPSGFKQNYSAIPYLGFSLLLRLIPMK